jgi:hypothetical protein
MVLGYANWTYATYGIVAPEALLLQLNDTQAKPYA